MSQKVIKSARRRLIRLKAYQDMMRDMMSYIEWCKQNVKVRDDDGVEYELTDAEALQFIIMTTSKK